MFKVRFLTDAGGEFWPLISEINLIEKKSHAYFWENRRKNSKSDIKRKQNTLKNINEWKVQNDLFLLFFHLFFQKCQKLIKRFCILINYFA